MELLIYKASAGSGKTFTLAVEYIKRLILNPRAYRQILAVTFTNKATTEMKGRILQQLNGIFMGDPASEAYLNRLKGDLREAGETFTEKELRLRAGTALRYIMHDYSRFRVETIDTFFQSVMRNLARELNLSPNLNIELNVKEVLNEAVDSLMEQLEPDTPLIEWILDYIYERIEEDKKWAVADEIKQFGLNIFDEGYQEKGGGLKECDTQQMRRFKQELNGLRRAAEEEMAGYGERFEKQIELCGISGGDIKYGADVERYFHRLSQGELKDEKILTARVQNFLSGPDFWLKKNAPAHVTTAVCEKLLPLMQEAEQKRAVNLRIINSCLLTLQHLNALQLLNNINDEVRSLNREQNRFLLSETNALLHKLIEKDDPSFVYEKIGTSIRNIMIDEFQDTSRMQWENFRRLLLEGLSHGEDSLIVGDIKQSIYRWRNGDWSILERLTRPSEKETDQASSLAFPYPIRVETLKTNRRSEANIIRFNNRIFKEAVGFFNQKYKAVHQRDCLPLLNAYSDVEQESPREETRGYVKATLIAKDPENPYQEATLAALGEEVRRLLASGVEMNDMAILVRFKKYFAPIADYFDKELHLPVVSDEAFRLDASQAVCLLMDGLRCLSNPDETIAKASLAESYRKGFMQESDELDHLLTAPAEEVLPEAFTRRYEELRLMPLYELLEELLAIFQVNRIGKQEAYLFSFFDSVTEYLQNNSSEPDAFIRYWDETLCQKTIPGGDTEGIRIFSIHKSKGLEFHTVLVPFCDWKTENERSDNLVWCHTDQPPFSQVPLIPVSYSSNMNRSIFQAEYLHEQLQQWVDNLNLLYVAFTRAGKNLLLWSQDDKENAMGHLLGSVLPQVAQGGTGTWDSEEGVYELGELCPSKSAAETGREEKQTLNVLSATATRLPVSFESLRHDIEFRQSNRSSDFIAGISKEESGRRFMNRGRLLHTLFSAIHTEEDIDPAVSRLVFEGVIGSSEEEQEIRRVARSALAQPAVKDWYSGEWKLFDECDIIWMENGELKNRRPDRVMMRNGEIVIVDFKFGKPNRKYNKQVAEYKRLLTRMGYDAGSISGYLWYVDEGIVEKTE